MCSRNETPSPDMEPDVASSGTTSNMANNSLPPETTFTHNHGHVFPTAPPPYALVEDGVPPRIDGLESSPPAYADVIKDWDTMEIADNYKERLVTLGYT